MKKITSVLLFLSFVLLFSACGNGDTSSKDFLSVVNNKENTAIYIGMTKAEVEKQLGSPKESTKTSDRYAGIELWYRNDSLIGYSISGENGSESNYQTGKGVKVGSKKTKVESTYGKGFPADYNSVNYWYNIKTMKLIKTQNEFDSLNKEDLFGYSFLYDKNDIVTLINTGDYSWTKNMK